MKRDLIPLTDPKDIPEFNSEAEAREFWNSHEITEEYLQKAGTVPEDDLPPTRANTQSTRISLRLEQHTLQRLKALAGKRGMGYQTLLKSFLTERLYEEERQEKR